MRTILAAIAVIAVVYLVLSWQHDPIAQAARQQANYYQNQAQALRLERQRLALEAQQAKADATAPAEMAAAQIWVLSLALAGGLVMVGVTVLLGVGTVAFFRQRLSLAYPDAAGRLPVRLADREYTAISAAALGAYHRTQHEQARQSFAVPASYAPHISQARTVEYGAAGAAGAAALSADATEPVADDALPGVIDLAALDFVPTLGSIMLGLGPGGQPVTVPIGRLFHVAIAGDTGGGKTNLARLLIPQLQAVGAKVCIADPNYADVDPETGDDWRHIRQRLYMPPAYQSDDISAMLDFLNQTLTERLDGRRDGQRHSPLFLFADELAEIIRQDKARGEQVRRLIEQGRKVKLYAIVASQDLLARTTGSAGASRENYKTAFWMGGDVTTGAVILDMPRREIASIQLDTGLAMVRSSATTPARIIRIPLASNAGVSRLLGGPTMTDNAPRHDRERTEDAPTKTASGSGNALDGLQARDLSILQRYAAGEDTHDIATDLNGGKKTGNYARILTDVNALVRRAYPAYLERQRGA